MVTSQQLAKLIGLTDYQQNVVLTEGIHLMLAEQRIHGAIRPTNEWRDFFTSVTTNDEVFAIIMPCLLLDEDVTYAYLHQLADELRAQAYTTMVA